MKALHITLCLYISAISAFAQPQAINCRVVDEAGKAIPFANVYNAKLERGTVTDEAGRFTIDASTWPAADELVFSCIGYEEARRPISLLSSAGCEVKLQSKAYAIGEVEVTDESVRTKRRTGGKDKGSAWLSTYVFGVGENIGYEVGTIIPSDGVCYVEEVGFHLHSVFGDTMIYEVNIYQYGDGQPGQALNKERVFLRVGPSTSRQRITVDLSEQRIRAEGAILVAIEAVGKSSAEVFSGFTMKTGIFSKKSMMKDDKTGHWMPLAATEDGDWSWYSGSLPIFATMRCVK